jgi:predicted ATPase
MKLFEFHAKDVFDYLNFDVVFNDDLTLLTGGNGCGKTTIIRLIQALLTASVRELNLISFKSVELIFENSGSKNSIVAKCLEDSIDIIVSGISEPLKLPKIDAEEIERRSADPQRGQDIFAEVSMKVSATEVFKFLTKLESPVILGLERRIQSSPILSERERYYGHPSFSLRRRIFRGTLGLSLAETQSMVQDAYRKIREYQDDQNETLRENILLSMFNYTTSDSVFRSIGSKIPSWQEQEQILKRRKEVESSLVNIVTSQDKITSSVNEFFQKIDNLFKQMRTTKDKDALNLDWLLNKAQIDRIMSIIEVVDRHKTSMDKFMEPLNLFLEAINGFYSDSNKSVGIDPVGCLIVKRSDNKVTSVESLSSGERQLLIIFAHLMYNRYSGRSGVFIIDEPELSLHLKWQSMFIEQITRLSPNTQFIMATHSPEIVGDYTIKCYSLSEANK